MTVVDLAPFRALRYSPEAGDLSPLLAPPYDVVDPDLADALRARSPFNAVRLVLPEGEAPGRYERAADRLRAWEADGILRRDDALCVYAYEQLFEVAGSTRRRRALFGALRLTELARGEVLPHEETHAGPKRDRMALLEATRSQLSAVLLVGRDPHAELLRRLVGVVEGSGPEAEATTRDGVRHRLWRIAEPEDVKPLTDPDLLPRLLVADGHHRYETALAFRDRHPDLGAAGRVLAAVVSDADAGLVNLPTHRSLKTPEEDGSWRRRLLEVFDLVDAGTADAETAARRLADGAAALALVTADASPVQWLTPRPAALAEAGSQPEGTWAPPLLFDRLVLRRCFDLDAESAVRSGRLGYHRDAREAVAAAGGDGAAFLLAPLPTGDLWQLVGSGGRLPPKSTYFWPKLPSGTLFRPLDDGGPGRRRRTEGLRPGSGSPPG